MEYDDISGLDFLNDSSGSSSGGNGGDGDGKVEAIVGKVIKKIKKDKEIRTNIPFPKDDPLTLLDKGYSLFDKGAEFNVGASGMIGDNFGYTVGAGLTSASPLNITEPTSNQLDTFNVYGGVGKENEYGALGVGVGYSDDTWSGNVTQTFKQPSMLDKYIGEDKLNFYAGVGKSESEQLKWHGGVEFHLKKGGLLDRKRS